MKKSLIALSFLFLCTLTICAQGTVTVTQSADIDALVNGKKKAKPDPKSVKGQGKKRNGNQSQVIPSAPRPKASPIPVPKSIDPKVAAPSQSSESSSYSSVQRTKLVRRKVRKSPEEIMDESGETRKVTKRVERGAKKMRGFRVLAYSGGNTRKARQEAERLGQKAKTIFPDQPIYVHFYSPRWMCQIGNFIKYEQARKVMRKLRREGFSQANVIRTMITVETSRFVDESLPNIYE